MGGPASFETMMVERGSPRGVRTAQGQSRNRLRLWQPPAPSAGGEGTENLYQDDGGDDAEMMLDTSREPLSGRRS